MYFIFCINTNCVTLCHKLRSHWSFFFDLNVLMFLAYGKKCAKCSCRGGAVNVCEVKLSRYSCKCFVGKNVELSWQLINASLRVVCVQFAWGHHPQRSETRTEPTEENLQHLRLWRHQGGPQKTLPAAGESAHITHTYTHDTNTIHIFEFSHLEDIYILDFNAFLVFNSPPCVVWLLNVLLCYHLSAHGSGSLLSRWEKLLVSLPERSPQQSLPKVLNTNRNRAWTSCCWAAAAAAAASLTFW